MKNFVKTVDKTGQALRYLAKKFPRISAAEVKEGVFVAQHIRRLFREEQFNRILNSNEKSARNYLQLLEIKFIGNNKADNYSELTKNLLLSYQK
ncbi:hypothetical protein Cfor_00537 [Coptotermes formosanus]|jgi:hypothetical protein|uniref:Uncharacterized protein n=1 Tax=Coptotermes formosanus TaxID=36987 RepID=A0A6L2PBK7_COPFO|nr:hypothetical protein Cfor_00537 [Coptotermes formosanus]